MVEPQYDCQDMDNFYLAQEKRALQQSRDELLIALKDLVADVEWFSHAMHDREPPHMLDSFGRAEAAIAKVEGAR